MAQKELRAISGESTLESARRGGYDYDLMRVRRLGYTELDARPFQRQIFFYGKTTEYEAGHAHHGTWTHGPYWVVIPRSEFGKLGDLFHLLPAENVHTDYRHPHHHTLNNPDAPTLAKVPITCEADFAGLLPVLYESFDLPGIFQVLFQFAGAINFGSTMISPGNIPGWRRR